MNKGSAGTAFVISPFQEPYDSYWSKLYAPALLDAGLAARRGDSIFRAGNVVRQIWEMITESVVVLAEVSEHNANVYYELGLTHAIGKPCILITKDSTMIPFDLRNQRHIVYDTNQVDWAGELRRKIVVAVEHTLEKPELSLVFPDQVSGFSSGKQSSTETHILMLQASIDALRKQIEAPEDAGLRLDLGTGTAEELRQFARELLASGNSSDFVIDALRARGAPRVWAVQVVREDVEDQNAE